MHNASIQGLSFTMFQRTSPLTEVEQPPRTIVTEPSVDQLTDQAGYLRDSARILQEDTDDLHRKIRALRVAVLADRVERKPVELLGELSDLGLSWTQIATMISVSVTAVKKWRKGDGVTPENFNRLAMLATICRLLPEFYITDPASWFEVRLLPDTPVRPMDLFAAGHDELLLDWASSHITEPERVLDKMNPEWREQYSTDFEVFVASDGEFAIRMKER